MPRTILLADDSPTIRRIVELVFGETDIRVIAVASGREALDRFPQVAPDVVLADVVMPEPSGYDVCRAVKASTRPVPVILLAGTFEPYDPAAFRECGADDVLIKPFEPRTLVERVEAVLERREAAAGTAFRPISDSEAPDGVAEPSIEAAPSLAVAEVSAGEFAAEEAMTEERAAASSAGPEAVLPRPTPEPFDEEPTPLGLLSTMEPGASPPIVAEVSEAHGAGSGEDSSHTSGESAAAVSAWAVEPGVPAASGIEAAAETVPADFERTRRGDLRLTPEEIDAVARAVIERLGDRVLREIAWDVVPDLAEMIIRERLRELEKPES